jgi:hypothetical protein
MHAVCFELCCEWGGGLRDGIGGGGVGKVRRDEGRGVSGGGGEGVWKGGGRGGWVCSLFLLVRSLLFHSRSCSRLCPLKRTSCLLHLCCDKAIVLARSVLRHKGSMLICT